MSYPKQHRKINKCWRSEKGFLSVWGNFFLSFVRFEFGQKSEDVLTSLLYATSGQENSLNVTYERTNERRKSIFIEKIILYMRCDAMRCEAQSKKNEHAKSEKSTFVSSLVSAQRSEALTLTGLLDDFLGLVTINFAL